MSIYDQKISQSQLDHDVVNAIPGRIRLSTSVPVLRSSMFLGLKMDLKGGNVI